MNKLNRSIRNIGNTGATMPGNSGDNRSDGQQHGRSDGHQHGRSDGHQHGRGDGHAGIPGDNSPGSRGDNSPGSRGDSYADSNHDSQSNGNGNGDNRSRREPGQRPARRQAAGGAQDKAAAGSGTETLRILLIEDDRAIRDAVLAYLESEGFLVTPCVDGEQALDCFANDSFDLIILDLMLPKISGEEVCQHIRGSSTIPIIILTAKDGVDDRINGLELGADDYLIKPFSPRELVARIRALLRRVAPPDALPDEAMPVGKLELGALIIDATARQASFYGEPIDLTTSEFRLLCVLGKEPGRVFTRAELSDRVLGYRFEEGHRSIDTHIKNLRYKLGEEPRSARWLVTVHGAGYRLDVADPLSGSQRRGA